jgi:hypothetical protein
MRYSNSHRSLDVCLCNGAYSALLVCCQLYYCYTGGSSEFAHYVTPCSHAAAASETAGSLHNCSIVSSSSNRDIFCTNSYAVVSAQPAHSAIAAAAAAAAATVTPTTAGADEGLAQCGSNSSSYSSISSYNGDDYCDSNRELRCLSAPTTDYCTDTTTAGTISTADTNTATVVYDVRRVASGSSGARRVRAPHAGHARAFEVAGTGHNESFSSSVSSSSGKRGSVDEAVMWLLTRHRPTLRLVSEHCKVDYTDHSSTCELVLSSLHCTVFAATTLMRAQTDVASIGTYHHLFLFLHTMCGPQQIFRKYCPGFVPPVRHLTSSRTAASSIATSSPLLRRGAAPTAEAVAAAVGYDSSYDAVEQLKLMGPPAARALLRDCGLYSDIGTGRLGVLSRSQLDKVKTAAY